MEDKKTEYLLCKQKTLDSQGIRFETRCQVYENDKIVDRYRTNGYPDDKTLEELAREVSKNHPLRGYPNLTTIDGDQFNPYTLITGRGTIFMKVEFEHLCKFCEYMRQESDHKQS